MSGRAVQQQAAPAAEISDLESVGALLSKETMYCDLCGTALIMWPAENLAKHIRDNHAETLWPGAADMWAQYESDKDLVRRGNFIASMRVSFVARVLAQRFDIYQKCVVAGAIIPPRQG